MCRSIKTLYNFQPPVTDEEIRAAALPSLQTSAPAKNREDEAAKARLRAAQRFA